jgi:hypothetical protein
LKSNDDDLRAKLQKERKSLDKQLPGVASFAAASKWNGTLSLSAGGSVQYSVRVDKLTGNLFKGYVWDNPSVAGHPEYQIEGTIDGLEVKFEATKVVQGGTAAAVFKGILTGDRMIGTLDQINAKGKHSPGIIVVNLGK